MGNNLQIITTQADLEKIIIGILEKYPRYNMPAKLEEIEILKARPYLSPQDVAILYDVSPDTLQTWRYQKKGPRYHKREKRVYYTQQDVRDYFDGGLVKTYD